MIPWWKTGLYPTWSHSAEQVAFGSVTKMDFRIVTLSADGAVVSLTEWPECLGVCNILRLSWSPTDTSLTYWQVDITSRYPSKLLLLDVITGEQSILLEGDYSANRLHWSPDAEYLAFISHSNEAFSQEPEAITIFDVNNREIILTHKLVYSSRIVGWISTY